MELNFYKSFTLPFAKKLFGSKANSSLNKDYCIYCFKDGAFSANCSMDETLPSCAPFIDKVHVHLPKPMTRKEFKQMLRRDFPNFTCRKP